MAQQHHRQSRQNNAKRNDNVTVIQRKAKINSSRYKQKTQQDTDNVGQEIAQYSLYDKEENSAASNWNISEQKDSTDHCITVDQEVTDQVEQGDQEVPQKNIVAGRKATLQKQQSHYGDSRLDRNTTQEVSLKKKRNHIQTITKSGYAKESASC